MYTVSRAVSVFALLILVVHVYAQAGGSASSGLAVGALPRLKGGDPGKNRKFLGCDEINNNLVDPTCDGALACTFCETATVQYADPDIGVRQGFRDSLIEEVCGKVHGAACVNGVCDTKNKKMLPHNCKSKTGRRPELQSPSPPPPG